MGFVPGIAEEVPWLPQRVPEYLRQGARELVEGVSAIDVEEGRRHGIGLLFSWRVHMQTILHPTTGF